MATPKKDPSEHKKSGRPETVFENGHVHDILRNVKHLNQLTDEAHTLIKDVIENAKVKANKRKAYTAKNILFLVSSMSKISKANIKHFIDSSDKFDEFDYCDSAVNQYKKIVTDVAKGLTELSETNPLRVDIEAGSKFLSKQERIALTEMINSGVTKDEMADYFKTFFKDYL